MLLACKVHYLERRYPVNPVAHDESPRRQNVKVLVQVDVVVREYLGFDAAGSVEHPALSVGHAPEALEEQTGLER
ncbi:MAG: hypothetical protein WDA71_13540, partial [Actinomycetota bacterium]